jgi:hypothetical protein
MPDDKDKKPKATRILLGEREPVKPSYETRRVMHFTPNGTSTHLEPTPETRAYQKYLEQEKADNLRRSATLNKSPIAPKAHQKNNFKENDVRRYNKKDKGDDFEI